MNEPLTLHKKRSDKVWIYRERGVNGKMEDVRVNETYLLNTLWESYRLRLRREGHHLPDYVYDDCIQEWAKVHNARRC